MREIIQKEDPRRHALRGKIIKSATKGGERERRGDKRQPAGAGQKKRVGKKKKKKKRVDVGFVSLDGCVVCDKHVCD